MRKHFIEESVVIVLGFGVGATLAMSIVPGDIILWAATGVCLGVFSHMFFSKNFGGELLWPFVGRHSRHKHRNPRPRSTMPHR